MSIKIDEGSCIGCGRCSDICPGNLLVVDNNLARIREPQACWGCTACVKECPVNAIRSYLGADMGGSGSLLYVKDHEDTLEWIIQKADGTTESIIIYKANSNTY
jgi:adenylylsulfate reductase, subunit B